MFKCELCGACSKPGQKSEEVVTNVREKNYPKREGANVGYKDRRGTKVRSRRDDDWVDDLGGTGWEIGQVKKVIGCDDCTGKGGDCPGTLQ